MASRHEYTRDLLGRVTHDTAAALGTGIDGAIRRLEYDFDGLGRLGEARSYDATTSGTVKNSLRFSHTSLWQVKKVYQNHKGLVTVDGSGNPTGDTVALSYSYSNAVPAAGTAGSNFSRISSMTMPYGNVQQYIYGASASLDDRISRVSESTYSPDGSTDATFLKYRYIGHGMAAEVDYPLIDVQLDYTLTHSGQRRTQGYSTGTSGEYPGYDRFGRILRQVWADGALTEHGGLGTVPNRPPVLEELYTYDRAGSRLSRTDGRPGASWGDRDFTYDYDGLDRLEEAHRGVSGGSWTAGKNSQKWALDMLGNWSNIKTDANGDGDYLDTGETDTRTHNEANELTSSNTGAGAAYRTYDDNGNVKTAPGTRGYTHDAWNRLVKVALATDPETVIGEYEYYPLHWRSVKRADTTTVHNGLDQKRVFYYDSSWRIVEERIDDNYLSSAGDNRLAEQFWGTRYIDDPVLRRMINLDSGDDATPEYYHITDAQFSTRALLDSSATLVERVTYSAYGVARHHHRGDADGDADVDAADLTLVASLSSLGIGVSGYQAEADLNRDGVIGKADENLVGSALTALPSGWISDATGPDNPFGYDGYVYGLEIDHYLSRFRYYDPATGRWLTRDPLGTIDGVNRYAAVRGSPSYTDPFGLWSCEGEKFEGTLTEMIGALGQLIDGRRETENGGKLCGCDLALAKAALKALKKSLNQEVDPIDQLLEMIQAADGALGTVSVVSEDIENVEKMIAALENVPGKIGRGAGKIRQSKIAGTISEVNGQLSGILEGISKLGKGAEIAQQINQFRKEGLGGTNSLRALALGLDQIKIGTDIAGIVGVYADALRASAAALDAIAAELGGMNFCQIVASGRASQGRNNLLGANWTRKILGEDDPDVKNAEAECGDDRIVESKK